ncbi:hypothetical protein [Halogeometricum borinquense]|uniref:hypothetical protein n=1 Tax=Halogeometricum borinquense TaxID=60847 RepID=UPI003416B429
MAGAGNSVEDNRQNRITDLTITLRELMELERPALDQSNFGEGVKVVQVGKTDSSFGEAWRQIIRIVESNLGTAAPGLDSSLAIEPFDDVDQAVSLYAPSERDDHVSILLTYHVSGEVFVSSSVIPTLDGKSSTLEFYHGLIRDLTEEELSRIRQRFS